MLACPTRHLLVILMGNLQGSSRNIFLPMRGLLLNSTPVLQILPPRVAKFAVRNDKSCAVLHHTIGVLQTKRANFFWGTSPRVCSNQSIFSTCGRASCWQCNKHGTLARQAQLGTIGVAKLFCQRTSASWHGFLLPATSRGFHQ